MSAPLLAQAWPATSSSPSSRAIAFATILAVVAGLTISASTSFAHDFWTNVIHHGVERNPGEEVRVARDRGLRGRRGLDRRRDPAGPDRQRRVPGRAGVRGRGLGEPAGDRALDFLARFNTAGAVAGLAVGLLASIGLILVGPSLMAVDPPSVTGAARHLIQAKAWFPLENPGILSIPLGFLGAILGTLLSHEPSSEHKFNELLVRSNTGLGAERAGSK